MKRSKGVWKICCSVLWAILVVACSKPIVIPPAPAITTMTVNGVTYRLIRPATAKAADGSSDIELWDKEGETSTEYVYMRSQWSDGSSKFTRILR